MVRIKDIARQAGVSLSAVSLALNGKKGLSIETREHILKTAHEMNYQQLNKNKKRGAIRFMKIALHGNTINESHSLFVSGYIDGIIDEASRAGFSVEVVNYDGVPIEIIVQTQNNSPPVEGLIILGTEFEQNDFIPLRNLNIPFVIIDNANDFLPYDFVNMNNRGAVYKILEHFHRAGLTEIGLVYSDAHTPNLHQRTTAFHELTSTLGLRCMPHNMICVNSNTESAYLNMCDFLDKTLPLAQGYFCVNDTIAYGCIKALREFGWQVPEDVSIIGFDDLPISAVMEPALTTIQVSRMKMGSAAARILINKLTTSIREIGHTSILISGVLIKRNSVRKPR